MNKVTYLTMAEILLFKYLSTYNLQSNCENGVSTETLLRPFLKDFVEVLLKPGNNEETITLPFIVMRSRGDVRRHPDALYFVRLLPFLN
jgi:hypothetical protein